MKIQGYHFQYVIKWCQFSNISLHQSYVKSVSIGKPNIIIKFIYLEAII